MRVTGGHAAGLGRSRLGEVRLNAGDLGQARRVIAGQQIGRHDRRIVDAAVADQLFRDLSPDIPQASSFGERIEDPGFARFKARPLIPKTRSDQNGLNEGSKQQQIQRDAKEEHELRAEGGCRLDGRAVRDLENFRPIDERRRLQKLRAEKADPGQ